MLGAPVITTSTFLRTGQFSLSLTPPLLASGAITSYSARYITDTLSDWVFVDDITSGVVSGSSISATVSSLESGEYYLLQIRANTDNGGGKWSNVIHSDHSPTFMDFYESKVLGTESILPDFSYAGYHRFEKPIPDVTHTVFNVTDYGAIADDNISDQDAIQANH